MPAERLFRRARPRLTRLAKLPELAELVRLAHSRGDRVWMVGGALRDALLGRSVREIDLVVTGDGLALARAMELAGHGTNVPLSDLVPRVFRVAGRRDLDLAELTGGSIEADLARRDFTVNAIAWDLTVRKPCDPFGGAADLERKQLRLISTASLREDPLRVLRAARLYATHGLEPDRGVTRAARATASGLAQIASERIRAELVKLLEARRAAAAVRWLQSVGGVAPAFGFPASRARARRLVAALSRLDVPAVRSAGPGSRRRLRLCLIFANLGLSPAEAARLLTRRRFSREEAGDVAALLELTKAALDARTARQEWAWVRDSGERRADALRLFAILFPDRQRKAKRLAGRRPRRTVRVTGDDVMRWLEIPPGPAVGACLREVEIEAIRGAVRSREGARMWLQNTVKARPLAGGESPGRPQLPAPDRLGSRLRL